MVITDFEKLTYEVWGAYEYLRDNDLSAQSGTSKRLRSGDRTKLLARLIEELGELRGVVEGTHIHEGFEQDIVLEGYEVWYWAACLAIANGLLYQQLNPHQAFLSGYQTPPNSREDLLPEFDSLLEDLAQTSAGTMLGSDFQRVFELVGQACRLNETHPARLLERDKAEMSQKFYLAPYWQ